MWPESCPGVIGEDHVQRTDVIDSHAVPHRAAAGRIVADHPADGGRAAGHRVRPEHQPVARGCSVELVLDHAGLDPCGPGDGVDADDAVQVAGQVQHQAGADRLPGQAGAGVPGQRLDAVRVRCDHRGAGRGARVDAVTAKRGRGRGPTLGAERCR